MRSSSSRSTVARNSCGVIRLFVGQVLVLTDKLAKKEGCMVTRKGSGGLPPLKGAALAAHAQTVTAAIIATEPHGLNLDDSIAISFSGPTTMAQRDWAKAQFLRARKFSNRMFNKRIPGWYFIWAGPDKRYHVIVGIDSQSRAVPTAPAGALDVVEPFTTRRLRTQIRSRQTVRAALGQQLIKTGTANGNRAMIARGNDVLDELVILNPRLHLLGADMGELVDVARLAKTITTTSSLRTKMLLQRKAKRIDRTIRRLRKECVDLTNDAVAIQQIYQKGALLPPPSP